MANFTDDELAMIDETKFYEYFRMSKDRFYILLNKIEPHLRKQDTHWRRAITPRQRLAVCLRYLATGDSMKTISFSYRLGHSTVYTIIIETSKIINENLLSEELSQPSEEKWKSIADDFYNLWNFPNCIGALEGKHISIQAPPNSGSLFFNYKKTFSVVLLALVDAQYNFIAIDVGAYGKNSDGGIFGSSNLGKGLQRGSLSVPKNSALPGTDTEVPYVIVGDEAFPLKTYLMGSYPGQELDYSKRIFNYRLCRARRIVENAFGILSHKNSERTNTVTDCASKQTAVLEHLPMQVGNASIDAFRVRDLFKQYFVSNVGSVPWQDDRV